MEWTKVELLDRLLGREVLGVRIVDGVIVKEPFITFWSPSLNRFYGNPTHWILLPDIPSPTDSEE